MPSPAPRLIIVDDSPLIRDLVRTIVTTMGYDVVGEAADGREGVATALRLTPDVVVMDWCMPELDGVAATREIHEHRPHITVIAFSSASALDVEKQFLAAGAVAYVDKADTTGLFRELQSRKDHAFAAGVASA